MIDYRTLLKRADTLPIEIDQVGLPYDWDEREVWDLDIPTDQMSVEDLKWQFDVPFWDSPSESYSVRPSDVFADKDAYPDHKRRIEDADTHYPLDVILNPKTDKWTLLDGLHRLAKWNEQGVTDVPVRRVTVDDLRKTRSFKDLTGEPTY